MDQSDPPPSGEGLKNQTKDLLVTNLGLLIRQERQKLGLTLVQVCEQARISPAFLSLVERGKATPSLGTLAAVAKALGQPVSAFLQIGLPAGSITRAGERRQFSIEKSAVRYERLSTVFPGQQVDAVMMHIPAGYRSKIITNNGEEWIYILSGELHQTIEGTTIALSTGDTCHFRGDSPHSYQNRSRKTAVVLWVGTVPLFRGAELAERSRP